MNWNTENMPSLEGKTIIVTGGNSGLGFQSVKAFASKKAQVVLACRDYSKGEEARKEIIKSLPDAQIAVMTLDLADLSSVRTFADRFKREFSQLDILLNNAGIMMPPYQLTKDGIESQQGTNHFGHFALTGLLLEKLAATPNARVVNVSSIAHKQGKMDFDNLLYDQGKGYTALAAYSRSKLENLLFTYALQDFFKKKNLDIKALVAHPGVSDTNLFNKIGGEFLQKLMKPLFNLFVQPAEMGAFPQLRAAVEKNVTGGEFFGPNGMNEMRGYPVLTTPNKNALNTMHQELLWHFSEKITGVKYE